MKEQFEIIPKKKFIPGSHRERLLIHPKDKDGKIDSVGRFVFNGILTDPADHTELQRRIEKSISMLLKYLNRQGINYEYKEKNGQTIITYRYDSHKLIQIPSNFFKGNQYTGEPFQIMKLYGVDSPSEDGPFTPPSSTIYDPDLEDADITPPDA